jgi:hypothetical protein
MAKFDVTVEGSTYEVEAPNERVAWTWANQTHAASKPKAEVYDPTAGMSTTEKFAAGAGKAIYDVGRGAGKLARDILPEQLANRLDLPTQADIDEAKRLDAALMRTGAGTAGNIVGNVAATLPAALIPGAGTFAGGAAIGAGLGALQPTATGESRASNMVLGGLAGGALPAAIGGYRALKAGVYEPLAAQQKVIGGALTRSLGEEKAAEVAKALRAGAGAKTPGVQLSAGTVSENEALSAIEDALRSQLPSGELTRQAQANRSSLASSLRNIGKDEEAIAAAKEARDLAADTLYGKAFQSDAMRRSMAAEREAANVGLGEGYQIPKEDLATPGLRSLMQRPTFQQAATFAKQLAADKGVPIGNPLESLQGLHYIKIALDKMKSPNATTAAERIQNDAVQGISNALTKELSEISPLYGNARQAFTEMSQPINQMQIGQALTNKLIPATSGEAPAALNYASLANALRNPDVLAQKATGFKGAQMEKIMSPEQMSAIQGVESDASKIAEALKRGMGTGSPTARRLTQGNMISEHFAENAPIASYVISLSKVPGVNLAARGASALGGLAGKQLNTQMIRKLDELLATNPQQVAKLIENELAYLTPTERSQVVKMLPQTLMLSLPSMQD